MLLTQACHVDGKVSSVIFSLRDPQSHEQPLATGTGPLASEATRVLRQAGLTFTAYPCVVWTSERSSLSLPICTVGVPAGHASE